MRSIILLALILLARTVSSATIDYVDHHYGSSNGATTLKVIGTGFADNSFSFGDGNSALGNKVNLVSQSKSYECEVDNDASDENTITCYTIAMLEGITYYVRVQVNGGDVPVENHCAGNPFLCSFQPVTWRTPYITGVQPKTGLPGSLLTFSGKIYTDKVQNTDVSASNGGTMEIERTWITGGFCQLFNGSEPYGVELNCDSNTDTCSQWGLYKCLLMGGFVGSQNGSVIVNKGYGRSKVLKSALIVCSDNKLCSFQTYAAIDSVTPTTGSTHGGTNIVVTGQYLNDSSVEVKVGGAPCPVVSRQDTSLSCTSPPESDFKFTGTYPGSRGVDVEIYPGLNDASTLDGVSYDDYTTGAKLRFKHDDTKIEYTASSSPAVMRMQGFFVPGTTGHYTFGSTPSAGTTVYVSSDETVAAKAVQTGPILLTAGKHYFYEVVHSSSSSQISVTFHAYLAETAYTYTQTSMAKADEQLIVTSSPDKHEIQKVTLNNWANNASTVNQVLSLCIKCSADCTGSELYKLRLHEVETGDVLSGALAYTVQTQIKSLPTIHGESIVVEKLSDPGECFSKYTITVGVSIGSLPLQVLDVTTNGSSLVESTASVMSRASFTVAINGVPSPPAQIGSTFSVESAVKSLFSPTCPTDLAQPSGSALFLDFESTPAQTEILRYSGSVTVEDSYCKSKSLKNPSYLTYTPESPLLIGSSTKFCIAYKGKRTFSVTVNYQFVTLTATIVTDSIHYNIPEGTADWNHICKDLYSGLDTSIAGYSHSLTTLSVTVPASDEDFFIDNVYLGTLSTSDSVLDDLRRMRKLPQVDIKLEYVNVQLSNDEYSITMAAFECQVGIPLLEIAYGMSDGSGTYTNGSWEGGSITVTREQEAAPAIGGTFTLTMPGDGVSYGGSLPNIVWNVEADVLKNEVESLPGISEVTITRQGTCRGYTYSMRIESPGGRHQKFTVVSSFENSDATISITPVTDGGLYLDPIPGDYMRVADVMPQVEIFINNIPSLCTSNLCSYNPDASISPSVVTANVVGTTVTITGTAFSAVATENTVKIGGTACEVQSSTATNIVCTIGESPAGKQNVIVNVDPVGSSNAFECDVPIGVTSVSPTTGSTKGGTSIVITGTGFSATTTVTIGTACDIKSVSYSEIICVTAASAAGATSVTVAASDQSDSSQTFTFEVSAAIGEVSAASTTFSVLGGTVTITGSGFGGEQAENRVLIGSAEVEISSWTDTQIEASASSLAAGTHVVSVYVHPHGYADLSARNEITYNLQITNVDQVAMSLMGGLELSITGLGFESATKVSIGDGDCEISSKTDNTIECTTAGCQRTHTVTNLAFSNHGEGYAWNPAHLTVKAGDTVRWQWQQLPGTSGASYQVFSTSSASSTAYDGNGFNSGPQTPTGVFEYQFNIPGTYYIGGQGSATSDIFMTCVVVVTEPADTSNDITVNVGSFSDTYASQISCQVAQTPIITEISPTTGNSDTLITITGTGFSATAAENTVRIGNSACIIQSSSATSLSFKIDPNSELSVGLRHEVTVHVSGKGRSRTDIRNSADRSFVVLPHISALSPTSGSLEGGTTVTVTGGGLNSVTSMTIGGVVCVVEPVGYHSAKCVTGKLTEGSYDMSVDVFENGFTMSADCIVDSCAFSYSAADTVSLTSISPTSSTGQTDFTIAWNGQSTYSVNVLIGSTACTVSTVSDTSIVCQVDGLPVGDHQIVVNVIGKGNAQHDGGTTFTVNSPAQTSSVTPSSGSTMGATVITIPGNGFVNGDTQVDIGGNPCSVSSVTTSAVVCTTPARSAGTVDVTVTSGGVTFPVQQFDYSALATPVISGISSSTGSSGDSITLTGTNLQNVGDSSYVSFGGEQCIIQSQTNTEIQCTLGSRFGGTAAITAYVSGLGAAVVNSDVTFSYVLSITGISPAAGSLGGGQTVTITGEGFSEAPTVTICGAPCVISGVATATSLTCVTSVHATGGMCDVVLSNIAADEVQARRRKRSAAGNQVQLTSAYNYDPSLTSTVTTVSPGRGGTGGGTRITVTGLNLSGVTEVTIDGSNCDIDAASITDTQVVCDTGSHQGTVQAQVKVRSGTNGIAVNNDDGFFYVDVWSSKFTWGGVSLPQEGEFVVIQQGQTVLLDTETPVLSMLLIQGGSLIFDNVGTNHLEAFNILITNGGLLQIGTEAEPYTAQAKITMHGHLRSQELPIYGAKTLGLREGRIEMHGEPIDITWTLLDSTAAAGSTQITLQTPVPWKVGNVIVIASTGGRHSQEQNEQHTITAITTVNGKSVITLENALAFEHLGVTETYTTDDGTAHTYEYRAEVGLLSRNIVFRGSDDVTWHDNIERCPDGFDTGMFATQTCFQGRFGEEVGSDQYGASIMIHSPTPTTDPNNALAVAHIEYVELTYVGQAFRLGRYPIHWHLMGDMTGNYVRGCALHKSFNRAVTIHGTHNLLVERNVIYNIMGGAFFIEDGIETGNVIQYNLAVFVKQSTSLLNDDITPAAYWVTNPNNTLQHNHAAGGTHFGFWYRMHKHPDGPSFDPNICQQHVILGKFDNNTVHSQGWFGLWIFQSYFPKEGSGCNSISPMAAKFYGLTAWHCEKGAEWVEGGAIQYHGFKLASNDVNGIDIKLIFGTEWDKGDRGALIKDTLIVGHANFEESGSHESTCGIALPFSPGLWMDNVIFININKGSHSALFFTQILGTCTSLCGGFYYRVENMKFVNTPKRVRWRWPNEGVIQDMDGSFTGKSANTKVVPSSPSYWDGTDCEESSDIKFSDGHPSTICTPNVRFHRFAFNNILPSSYQYKVAIFENENGQAISPFAKKRLTHTLGWMVLLRGGYTYTWYFNNSITPTNTSWNGKFYDFIDGDYVILKFLMYQRPDRVSLFNGDTGVVGSTNPITPSSGNREWHYDEDTNEFSFMVRRPVTSRKKRATMSSQGMIDATITNVDVYASLYRCLFVDCEAPVPTGSHEDVQEAPSDTTTISSLNDGDPCFEVTGTTDDDREITIPSGCWIIWAIPEVTVKALHVKGYLVFDPSVESIKLTATYIIVEGRFIAGWANNQPHKNPLHILLTGGPTDRLEAGGTVHPSKTLLCYGTCKLHGKKVGVSWTKLAATAAAGSTEIVLQTSVDWSVGDEIVIAPTGFSAKTTEKHQILEVSPDGRTFTLTSPLAYDHKHEVRNYGGQWSSIDMSAEVGLLTRNIKIEGVDYGTMNEDSYGARVFVSTTTSYSAICELSNVEFFHTGQVGFYDEEDPRFSVTYKSAGLNSEVIDCAFHDGFSTAIGTFGTSGVNITGNVVHHTVNEGIVIKGSANHLVNNLVVYNIFRGSYQNRFEKTNFDYTAAINVESSLFTTMTNNVVAGAERVAYRINGQPCENLQIPLWSGNVAHATLIGTFQMAGTGTCSITNGFLIYHVWDFGIYHQTSDNIRIENTAVIDATVGYAPLIVGPAALTHEFQDKSSTLTNCLFVGRRDQTDCTTDADEDNDRSLIIRRIAGANKKAPSNPTGGRSAILLALFASKGNGATFKPLIGNKNYPAIRGLLKVEGVTFTNFGQVCSGKRDIIFFTNPLVEDIFHPTHVSGLQLNNVDDKCLVFLARPSIGKINPSDCVDMQCDAKLKVLINDLDGSFIGSSGSIFSQAEYGWDGDRRLGVGDYRIPKPMLTDTDGTRLYADVLVPHKGIARNDACQYVSDWQGYKCSGQNAMKYRMLVIESLDADSETRRLSPVAVKMDTYIDLNNGPQDHGWCAGYTCQKRISTFYTIVPTGKHFDIFFTGTPPQNFRLHLINAGENDRITVCIWIPNPQRLDVSDGDGNYKQPANAYLDAAGRFNLQKPDANTPDMYKPVASSCVPGDNYLDFKTRTLCLCVGGGDKPTVTVATGPTILVNFDFPALTVDEFFGDNLVNNLAALLNIPSTKIRFVNVVSETSRKKRSTTTTVSVELLADTQEAARTLRNTLMEQIQRENFDVNGTAPSSVTMNDAETADKIAETDANLVNGVVEPSAKTVGIPSNISLVTTPTGQEKSVLSTTPIIHVVDLSNQVVDVATSYMVSVTLDKTTSSASDSRATLTGTTTRSFTKGIADFSDLVISYSGSYYLVFTPTNGLAPVTSGLIVVEERSVCARVTQFISASPTKEGDNLQFQMQLTNCSSHTLEDISFKGYTYKIDVSFDDASMYGASVNGTTTFDFDAAGALTTTRISLAGTTDYYFYNLKFRLYTDPASSYDKSAGIQSIQIFPSDSSQYIHTDNSNQQNLELVFNENYADIIGSLDVETVETGLYNDMVKQFSSIYFTKFSARATSDGRFQLYTAVTSVNATDITDFYKSFDSSGSLSFGSRTLTIAGSCGIRVAGSCYGESSSSGSSDSDNTTIIVFSALGACVFLSIVILATTYLVKRFHVSKISALRDLGGSPTSLNPLHEHMEGDLSWSRATTPDYKNQRMPPVTAP